MNDTTQKIASEAAERIADLCESHPSLTREIKREIQSAIKEAYKKGFHDRGRAIELRPKDRRDHRAAHAGEPLKEQQ